MRKTDSTHVYLDVRHFEDGHFQKRFPFIGEICKSFDIDPQKDLIPVRPSAHYMIGGVEADENAKTNLLGLWACGEVASTGLHGANRLASNSLLEGLVFGKIAAVGAVENAKSEIKAVGEYDFTIINDTVEKAAKEFIIIAKAARLKQSMQEEDKFIVQWLGKK